MSDCYTVGQGLSSTSRTASKCEGPRLRPPLLGRGVSFAEAPAVVRGLESALRGGRFEEPNPTHHRVATCREVVCADLRFVAAAIGRTLGSKAADLETGRSGHPNARSRDHMDGRTR